jgi:cytochrome P450
MTDHATAPPLTYDPADPDVIADPYPTYSRLRDAEPVHHSEGLGIWVLTRYDDVVAVLRDHERFSSTVLGGGMGGGRFLIGSDPPDHTTLRRLVNRPFTPSAIAALEPRIRAIAEELVDDLVAANEAGAADLVTQVAVPLPVMVIAEMLGIEPERRDDFKRWSDAVMGGMTLELDGDDRLRSVMEMYQYFAETVEARRARPGTDLISALIQAEEPLTDTELGMFCMLLLIAGNETTTNLIGNATLALFEHPDAARRLRDDPSLVSVMIEEALRYDAPVQGLARCTTADVELHGHVIPAGATVGVLYGAANRDGRKFANPDRFDLERESRDHVGFGSGIHLCLGAPLARLEARVLAETMLARTSGLRPSGPHERVHNMIVRGVRRLPVTFEPMK